MSRLLEEKSKFVLKLEVSIPDVNGGPPKKFAINRGLKARWSNDSDHVIKMIFEEIANYKGSFVGDMAYSLLQAINEKELPNEEIQKKNTRDNEVLKWSSSLIQYFIYASIKDKLHEEFLENPQIQEWDGSTKEMNSITPEEINSIDVDRLSILLAPHIKHALYLLSKEIKNDRPSDGCT